MDAAGAQKRGDEFVQQAKKKLGGWSFFGLNSQKYDDAAALYSKAGAQYKIAKNWNDACEAYTEYANISLNKLSVRSDACTGFSEAGRAIRNENTDRACDLLQQAANMYMEDNRFSPAAKLWVEIAEMYVHDLNNEKAINAYNAAAECYKNSNSVNTAQSLLIKAADLYALEKQYKEAISIYEEVGNKQSQSGSASSIIITHYFKALLCCMAAETDTGVEYLEKTESKLNEYCDIHSRLHESKESNLIEELCKHYSENNDSQFTAALAKYDSIYRLDKFTSEILYRVKQNLNGEGKAAEAQHENDLADLA